MQLQLSDTYYIQHYKLLSSSDLNVLMTLYQPLIGSKAITLYLTMVTESQTTIAKQTHQRLFTLLNAMQEDDFLHAKSKLEEYMLLRTFYKQGNPNHYFYVLRLPMCAKDFLSTKLYANQYQQAVGKDVYEQTLQHFSSDFIQPEKYTEITVPFMHAVEEKEDVSIPIEPIQPRLHFSNDDTIINFDYDSFISKTSALTFPSGLRTQENMALIGMLATVHGLSPDTMRIHVSHCISLANMHLDVERLKVLCERSKPDILQAQDRYDLPPVSFLQTLQNGALVSIHDRKILEHLAMDMQFPTCVINIMIEHILKLSNNRLNQKFVDMVASEWARDNVFTKEKALQETKKQVSYQKRNQTNTIQIQTPSYMQQKEKETQIDTSSLLSEIQQLQKKMKR